MKKNENPKKRNRRYYLHKQVKKFTTMKAYERHVDITEDLLDSISEKQKSYLSELVGYGYGVQHLIK